MVDPTPALLLNAFVDQHSSGRVQQSQHCMTLIAYHLQFLREVSRSGTDAAPKTLAEYGALLYLPTTRGPAPAGLPTAELIRKG